MALFTNEVLVDSVVVSNFPASQPVTGPLTDTELRATPVPVSTGGLTDTELRATPVPVSTNGLTDTELRATPVPVSGSVTTTPTVATSSTVTQVTSTGSNQTLLVANANRKQSILYFESGIWFIKLGTTASASSLTYKVSASNTLIEIPEVWKGQIDVLCTTAGKLVDVTELV